MYTAQLISDAKSLELRSRLISVKFTEPYQEEVLNEETQLMETIDRERVRIQEFRFRIDEPIESIKKAVKAFLDELNYVPVEVTGAIDDVPADVAPTPTQAELDRQAWEADVAKLKKVYSDMLNLGVVPKPAMVTAIEALRTKIANNAKAEYLG